MNPGIVSAITVVGALIAMLYGLYKVFTTKTDGFGVNTCRAMGIVLFIPALLILAVTANFQSETLAALLGTVAGYVLSNTKPEKN
jgi:hypothetical protein